MSNKYYIHLECIKFFIGKQNTYSKKVKKILSIRYNSKISIIWPIEFKLLLTALNKLTCIAQAGGLNYRDY